MISSAHRALLALALVTLALTGTVGLVGAETATVPAPQQPLATELDLEATLTGDLVVVAGWFELTATAEGRLDTSAQETNFGGTYDVDLAETFGEFEFRGELLGTVNASRVLFTFEGNASSFRPGAPGALATASPATASVTGESQNATLSVTPLQLRPLRPLGISFFDVYWQLATLLLGLVAVGVFPHFSRRVADVGANDPVRTGGAGLAVVLAVPVALLVLGLSLFGIPLALAGTAVYLVFWWIGAVYGRFAVGLWLLGAVSQAFGAVDINVRRVENRWAGLLVGTAVVGLLVLLPVVGQVIEAAVILLGLGGITRLAYQSYRRTERGGSARTAEAPTGSDGE